MQGVDVQPARAQTKGDNWVLQLLEEDEGLELVANVAARDKPPQLGEVIGCKEEDSSKQVTDYEK